ncbi:hypothetical protein PGT21_030384 [Puccinia graminis f. sp. tritici]|uniref:Uncharacterized protein n=1 Tax=Puccinia graminis f. sp. tritici TaxID=56615 RepID=A0A5B0MG74_PUCGR|nr:hypothetical protein PGT21_030384 [Puccinia graminis f. sp. tritici]
MIVTIAIATLYRDILEWEAAVDAGGSGFRSRFFGPRSVPEGRLWDVQHDYNTAPRYSPPTPYSSRAIQDDRSLISSSEVAQSSQRRRGRLQTFFAAPLFNVANLPFVDLFLSLATGAHQ